jgi:hypothetical protein
MSDNAASHDSASSEVHRDTRAGTDPDQPKDVQEVNTSGEVSSEVKETRAEVEDAPADTQPDHDEPVRQPSASPPPIPARSPTPVQAPTEPEVTPTAAEEEEPVPQDAEENNENAQEQEPLFMNGDDEEGLDPDTLANLAALSRLARDEGDGDDDEDNEGVSGGENDFSTLLGDSQHSMTREQMQDIVARLAQHGEDDPDGEGEDDQDMDAEGEDEYPQDGQDGQEAKHKRENSEDLREVDDEQKQGKQEGDTDYKSEGGRRKRKRNRTVL